MPGARLQRHVVGIDRQAFLESEVIQDAVCRCIDIHGWESGDYHSSKASLNSMFMYDVLLQGLAFAVALNTKGLEIEENDVPAGGPN